MTERSSFSLKRDSIGRVRLLTVAFLLFTGGCTKPLYHWGSYEGSLYRMYSTPETFNLENEIQLLASEVEQAVESDSRIPPGKIAHLGYLYFQQGNYPLAREAFIREKKLFPESTVFMDRLIQRLQHEQ